MRGSAGPWQSPKGSRLRLLPGDVILLDHGIELETFAT